MSVVHRVTIYLRCEHEPAEWSPDSRCTVTFGGGDGWPDTPDAREVLARQARADGWTIVEVDSGLLGTHISSICPDHATPGAPTEDPQP